MLAFLLIAALLAFETFNYDTTKFALQDLLGDTSFMNLSWAAILAFAFCAIDFAGLIKLFTPEVGGDEPFEVWYLMGAWLLGATLNAIMTWYAVSLILIQRPIGSEVLSREQIIFIAPIFVATLVWLTRILFIGSIAVAGDHLINGKQAERKPRSSYKSGGRGSNGNGRRTQPTAQRAAGRGEQTTRSFQPVRNHSRPNAPMMADGAEFSGPVREPGYSTQQMRRISRRPASPGYRDGGNRPPSANMMAKNHR
ncbi:MAG: hypothetical protein AAF633_06615 [Chloroflexota bacterium]